MRYSWKFRQDLSCRHKVAYDMEGAAARWDTHPGQTMYVCTHCGYVHFSSNNFSIMDRLHEKAIRMDHNLIVVPEISVRARTLKPKAKRFNFKPALPERFSSEKTTCKIPVWKASGCSIGELLKLKAK